MLAWANEQNFSTGMSARSVPHTRGGQKDKIDVKRSEARQLILHKSLQMCRRAFDRKPKLRHGTDR